MNAKGNSGEAGASAGGGVIVAIETSFDDSAIAAIDGRGRIAYGFAAGQIELHKDYGGVVPEIAARSHLTSLPLLMDELKNRIGFEDVSLIAVTRGPGLAGSLLAGVNFAQGAALGLGVPCIGLNHLEGHIVSPFLESRADGGGKAQLEGLLLEVIPFPHLAVVVSGGNTLLVRADRLGDYYVAGETLDDAGGELLDKIAVALGRDYPGGAQIEKLAMQVDDTDKYAKDWLKKNPLPVPMRESGDLNFSYSGLKTAALRLMEREEITAGGELEPLFCRALLDALVESIWIKVRDFLKDNPDTRLVTASGGVAANRALCGALEKRLERRDISFKAPSKALAVDNAEMMAYLAWLYAGTPGGIPQKFLEFDADPALAL